MNYVITTNFNEVMGEGDSLYHLGDVAWKDENAFKFFDSLRVKQIHLVFGNHDNESIKNHPKIKSHGWLKKTKIGGGGLTMSHFPMLAWMGMYHVHGHWHCKQETYHPRVVDVGVDGHNFYPWSEEQLIRRFNEQGKASNNT
jgi:calcineurin-like phosphoesterase family protein